MKNKDIDPRQYETFEEAAERLRCHKKTIRRLVANGTLKGYRLTPGSRILRVSTKELDDLMERNGTAKWAAC